MTGRFTETAWGKIEKELEDNPAHYSMPEGGREKSLILGSFNIRKLGKARGREHEIDFMARFCAACDLVAIQEVQDNLNGLRLLKERTEARVAGVGEYALAVSDITGEVPGEFGMAERLAFLYRHRRVRRLELASDLTFDRTAVLSRFFAHEDILLDARRDYEEKLQEFHQKKRKTKPEFVPPTFLTFVRTPYVVAFEAPAANNAPPLAFTAVNAHLVYGAMKEREQEFEALIKWLTFRLKARGRTLTPNFILMGDLNLNFDNPRKDRKKIDTLLRSLNEQAFGYKEKRRIYFPLLDAHPIHKKILRTNARSSETFDQFGFFNGAKENRLPNDEWLGSIAKNKPDGFDFGVFDFADLFSKSLNGKSYRSLNKDEKKKFGKKFEHSLSDHLPIWVRIPRPGF